MWTLGITALPAAIVLAACTTATPAVGHQYDVSKTATHLDILTDIPPCDVRHGCAAERPLVRVTNDPGDEEFWQFEARIMTDATSGITDAAEPRDHNVIGPRDRCEDERVHWTARAIPTGPCRGPFFFRPQPSAVQASGPGPVEYSGAGHAYPGFAGGPADFADHFYGARGVEVR